MRDDIRSRSSPPCRLAHASKSAPVTISSSRINFRTKVAFFIPARFDRLARIPCSSLLKRTVRTAGIVFLLYAISYACQPSYVANNGNRQGWRSWGPLSRACFSPHTFWKHGHRSELLLLSKRAFFFSIFESHLRRDNSARIKFIFYQTQRSLRTSNLKRFSFLIAGSFSRPALRFRLQTR